MVAGLYMVSVFRCLHLMQDILLLPSSPAVTAAIASQGAGCSSAPHLMLRLLLHQRRLLRHLRLVERAPRAGRRDPLQRRPVVHAAGTGQQTFASVGCG